MIRSMPQDAPLDAPEMGPALDRLADGRATDGRGPEPQRQTKRIDLRPGFYVFRYLCKAEDGEDEAVLPRARVVAPEDASVEMLGDRDGGAEAAILRRYGAVAVVRVKDRPASLALEIEVPPGFGKRPVDIRLESIDRYGGTAATTSLVRLSGHMEWQGDREAGLGAWLGDPAGARRLEGFTVHWPDRPLGVDLSYGCVVAGMGPSPAAVTGGFVGARRRALPVQAVWASLIGERAGEFSLRVDAVFARRGKVSALEGGRLRGEDRDDHLVALRVIVRPRGEKPEEGGGA